MHVVVACFFLMVPYNSEMFIVQSTLILISFKPYDTFLRKYRTLIIQMAKLRSIVFQDQNEH